MGGSSSTHVKEFRVSSHTPSDAKSEKKKADTNQPREKSGTIDDVDNEVEKEQQERDAEAEEGKGEEEAVEKFKVVLVGPSGVGKSSLLLRYLKNLFDPSLEPNMEVEIGVQFLSTRPPILLEIWNVPGQAVQGMIPTYLEGIHGAIIVTDSTRPTTFMEIPKWRKLFSSGVGEHAANEALSALRMPVILVASKTDHEDSDFSQKELRDIVSYRGMDAGFLLSAKTGVGVDQAFSFLLRHMVHQRTEGDPAHQEEKEQEQQLPIKHE